MVSLFVPEAITSDQLDFMAAATQLRYQFLSSIDTVVICALVYDINIFIK